MDKTQIPFKFWKAHSDRHRQDTELTVAEFLRLAHPTYHIARTLPSMCDLLGYAAAGFAVATPEYGAGHDARRAFHSAGSRLDKEPGKLEDEVSFGKWLYKWNDESYILYQVAYTDNWGRPILVLYLLAGEADRLVVAGQHPAIDALLRVAGAWSKELHDEIYVFDDGHWKKDKTLWKTVRTASWDDVVLDPKMKGTLIRDTQNFFDSRDLYARMSVPWKRGVIFHGVPGNGKTISIKALIRSLGERDDPVPSLYVKSFDAACNSPKWSIQRIFSHARSMAPCLLIFEDLDSLVEEKMRSYFLNEVDGLESNDGILMIGSTNHLERLDAAITKRPSRFDRKYHFKVPDEKERLAYARYWAAKFSNDELVDFPDEVCGIVAKLTDGFSFAYLKELFVTSLLVIAHGIEEEKAVDPSQSEEEDAGASDNGSYSDAVVVDRPNTTSKGDGDAEKVKEDGCEKEALAKPERVIPLVEIPQNLRGNLLLQVLQSQAQTLREQMDNSEGEDPDKANKGQNEPGPDVITRSLGSARCAC